MTARPGSAIGRGGTNPDGLSVRMAFYSSILGASPMRKGNGVRNSTRGFSAIPLLICVGLTSFCFVVAGDEFWLALLLASLIVPVMLRTYLVIRRRLAAGNTVFLPEAICVFLVSGLFSILLGIWLAFVIVVTQSLLYGFGPEFGPPLVLIAAFGLAAVLVTTLGQRLNAYFARAGSIRASMRRLAFGSHSGE
jgi:hypothetical protein